VRQLVRIANRQRTQQYDVEERKHCGGRTNAKRERDRRRDGESGPAEKDPRTVAEILSELLDPGASSRVAQLILVLLETSDLELSLPYGLGGWNALTLQVLGARLKVERQLSVDIAIELAAPK
jgi:hypothetical protein